MIYPLLFLQVKFCGSLLFELFSQQSVINRRPAPVTRVKTELKLLSLNDLLFLFQEILLWKYLRCS